jgi:hypothetical protein
MYSIYMQQPYLFLLFLGGKAAKKLKIALKMPGTRPPACIARQSCQPVFGLLRIFTATGNNNLDA